MHRSALALLDFSHAYDTVWKEKLLLSMHGKGIKSPIHQVALCLPTKIAKPGFALTMSSAIPERCDKAFPKDQCLRRYSFYSTSTISPSILPSETLNVLFADDVAVKGSGKTIEEAEDKVQKNCGRSNRMEQGVEIGTQRHQV